MASPRKSGGARSASAGKASKRSEASVEETAAAAETQIDALDAEPEAAPVLEAAEGDLDQAHLEAEVDASEYESAPAEVEAAVLEAEPAPVKPEPAFAQPVALEPAFAELAHAETVVEIQPQAEAVETAAEPVTAATAVDNTQTKPVVQTAEVNEMNEVSNIIEAPVASFTEAQGKARSIAETTLTETRAKFSQFRSAADEAVGAIESSYATVKNGAVELNTKALDALKAAAEANFEFVKSVFAVKSPSEYVTLHSEFARKQLEALQSNSKALGEIAQKIATESVEPIKAQVAKTLRLTH